MAATEIDIPDFSSSKKGEREDYDLSSEILEEKVGEFSGKKVKQVEVAETVNKEVETESETFFQALSVPIVSADEGTPEGCKAATTEDQEEKKSTKIEEEKPFHDQSVQIVASKEETEDQREQKSEESVTKNVESCSEIKQEEDTEEIKPSFEGGLQETPKDIPKEEVEDIRIDPQEASENGAKEERGQEAEESIDKFIKSSSEVEQKEDSEEIKPSVETEEKTELITDDCITSQTESHVESAEHEIKNDEAIQSEETGLQKVEYKEEVKHSDSSLTEIMSESPMVKEVSEETVSEKAGYEEGLNLLESCNIALKENEIGSKVEDEEKEQEDKSSDAQEANEQYENEAKDKIEENTSSSVETKENVNEEAILKDEPEKVQKEFEDFSKTSNENEILSKEENQEKEQELKMSEAEDISSDAQEVSEECENGTKDEREQKSEEKVNKIVHEETSLEKVEYEEEVKHSDSSNVEINEETLPISSKDEDLERKQEDNMLEENHSEGNELEVVKTKENIGEDIEEIRTSEDKVESEEGLQISDISNITLNENEIASKVTYEEKEQEVYVSEKGQSGGDDVTSSQDATCKEILKEEGEDKSSDAQEVSEKCDDGKEDKSEQKPEEIVNKSVKSSLETAQGEDTEDIKPSVETEQQEVGLEKTEYKEEEKYSESSNTETMVKEVSEEIVSEKVESEEGLKVSNTVNINLNEKEIVSKVEDEEKEQEVYVSGKGLGDDVTSSQDAKCEDIKETTIGELSDAQEVTHAQDATFEDIKETTIGESSDAQEGESGTNEKIEQKPKEIVNKIENTEEIKPSVETDEKEQVKITDNEEDVIKVCEETHLEKGKFEGVELSDNDIDQEKEKEQECIISKEDQGKDDVTCSQDATSIEELPEFVKPREYIEEDTEEIKSSDDIKIDEEALVNDDGQTDKSESPLVKEVSEVTESKKAESELNENEIVSKEENQEKEKDLKMSEVQDGGDDVRSSQNAFEAQEDKKEQKSEESDNKIAQPCSEIKQEEDTEEIKPSVETEQQELLHDDCITSQTESQVESEEHEVKSEQPIQSEEVKETTNEKEIALSSTPKEILKEEAEDRSSDAQEDESGANEKIEQNPEEIVNKIENTEEIKPSVETNEKEQVKITDNEEDVIEVCEETHLEKGKFEGVELSEKDEDQEKEKEQESIISEEDQGKDDVTYSQDATSIEEDTEEIKSRDEPKDDIKIDEEALVNDDGQTDKSESPLIKEVSEVTGSEKAESELNENEIVSKEENQEKEQELKMSEEVQGDGYDVTSSQNASNEDIKETIIGQQETTVANIEFKEQNQSAIDAQEDKKEQKSEESDNKIVQTYSETEQVEDIEEIKPSVETEQQELLHDDYITSKTESQVESEHEVKSGEPIKSDDGQKENVDSSQVNEVCEETSSEKVEYSEEVKETTNEKEMALSLMPKEILMEEVEEKSSDVQEVVCISTQTETEEKNEESSLEKVEIEEGVKAIETFKDEDQEKDQVDMSAEGQGEDNVTSSQVEALEEDLQEKNYQEEGKEPEFVETRESVKENTEEIESSIETKENMEQQGLLHVVNTDVCSSIETEPKEETMENEEKIEEEAIVNDDCQTDKSEIPLVKEVSESKEENQEKEQELKMSEEVQGGGDDATSSHNASNEDIKESTIGQHISTVVDFEESKDESALTKEILKEEAEDKSVDAQEASEQYDHNGAKDKIEENPEESANMIFEQEKYTEEIKPSVETDEKEQQEVCEETDLKKTESEEGIKLPDSSDVYLNEKEVETLSKDEYQEKEQEFNMPEKDAVAASEENLKVNEDEFFETRESMEEDNEVISTNVETEERVEQEEELPHGITTDVSTSAQMESQEESTETETPLIDSIKEVCDETSLEKVESEEGVKAIETFKDEDQEKDQVNKSTEGQGEDNLTSSQVAALEENLLRKNYQEEGKEPEFFETRESIEEDTEENKSSVETIENTTQTETMENEEKIEEEAMVNDDGQTEKSEIPLVKEAHEVIGLEKTESELNENETVSKEENQEKEKDLKMSEEVQDDVITSKNASSEDIKEATIGQHDVIAYSEEKTEQTTEIGEKDSLYMKEDVTQEDQPNITEDYSDISKDVVLTKEIEQVPLETQKEKGTDDLKEQIFEEDSNSTELQEKSTEDQKADVISYSDPSEIDESPKQALESVCDVQTPEVVADSEDSKVKEESIVSETTEYIDEKNGDEEHEVRANETSSAENLELHGELNPTSELVIEEEHVKETKPQLEQSDITSENIMENVIFTEKDEKTTTSNEKELADEVSSELDQPKGQIVEEIQEGQTETISEIIEDEITKKDENLSHDTIENPNDTTTKEEKCFQDARTREIDPVEEQNDDLDEASKEKSLDSNETTELEPQEDNVASSLLVTSTEDTPKRLPIDLESVYDEQIPESEDSNLKEECLTSATSTYVDEEKETVTKEISSDEKTEQTTEIGADDSLYEKEDVTQENQINNTEESEMSKDVILTEEVPLNIQKEKETDDLKEQIVEEDSHSTEVQEKSTEDQKEMGHVISYSDPIPVGVSEVTTDEISTEETTESKQVAEHLLISSRDAVLIKENLEVHEGLNPTSESVIEEDQVKETKPEQEQSDITSESIIKQTSEKDLADEKTDMEEDVTLSPENTENQNETIKNVILTDEVALETEKEEEKNEVNEHVSEEDICPTELDKTSPSNQKDIADEIEYSKPIPAGNNEVEEVKAESLKELENIQSAESHDLEFEKKEKDDEMISEIQTPETTLEMEKKEEHLEATNDTCQTLVDESLSEKKLVSMVAPEELASSTIEDQTNELVLETDKTKVEHSNITNKDQNLEFTEEELPKILVTEEKTLEEDENKEKETLSESQADDLTKTTSDSISSPKIEEKPTEDFEIASEVAEIVPEGRKVSESLPGNVPEASHVMLLENNDPETTTTTIEKNTPEVAVTDVEKHEKAFDYTSEAKNAECSDIQSVQKKEVDENIEKEIPTEKEPLEIDTPVTEDLEISQKHVTDDLKAIKASGTESQCNSEAFREEKEMDNEKEKSQTTEPAKILLTDMMHEQTKGSSEMAENLIEKRETTLTKDQQVDKEETGEKGGKTDEENEEEDEEEDNQMIDAPVMVEASKDIEVKTPKKSHNILSGVGSKVKHSIAKVKKAITGKSSPSKPPSPKEKDQVIT